MASAASFKCPNCDGDLRFFPQTQKYKCEFCGSEFEQKEIDKQAEKAGAAASAAEAAPKKGAASGEAQVYSCPSCGAEVVTDATTAATICFYCHNPVVLSGRLSGDLLPHKVIPFQFDREAAKKKFLEFVGGKRFVPRDFFSEKQLDTLTGVYFPYWMAEGDFRATATAEGEKTRVWSQGDTEFTEHRYFNVMRSGAVKLDNLMRTALTKENRLLVEGVMPFKPEGMKDFSMGYLSGFQAEKRDIEETTARPEMERELRKNVERLLRDQMKEYTSVSNLKVNYEKAETALHYCLLPVWTITYRGGDGKTYYFSMNGQTGTVIGDLPTSMGRVLGFSLAIGLVVFFLALLVGVFLL